MSDVIVGYCENGHAHYVPATTLTIEYYTKLANDNKCPRCGGHKRWMVREEAYRAAYEHGREWPVLNRYRNGG